MRPETSRRIGRRASPGGATASGCGAGLVAEVSGGACGISGVFNFAGSSVNDGDTRRANPAAFVPDAAEFVAGKSARAISTRPVGIAFATSPAPGTAIVAGVTTARGNGTRPVGGISIAGVDAAGVGGFATSTRVGGVAGSTFGGGDDAGVATVFAKGRANKSGAGVPGGTAFAGFCAAGAGTAATGAIGSGIFTGTAEGGAARGVRDASCRCRATAARMVAA